MCECDEEGCRFNDEGDCEFDECPYPETPLPASLSIAMDERQLRGVLIDPSVIETELGVISVHICPCGCGLALSQTECSPGCPYTDCEDRELHGSDGVYWCPLLQVLERTEGVQVAPMISPETEA